MNTVLLSTQFLSFSPSNKNTPLLALGGESEASFVLSSVRVFNQYFSTSLPQDCAHYPAPYPIRLSYQPGHYECFDSGHLTQAGPIRILLWNFFSSMGEIFSFVVRKLKVYDSELLVLCLSSPGETRTDEKQEEMILVSYSLILFLEVLFPFRVYNLPTFISNKSPFCFI